MNTRENSQHAPTASGPDRETMLRVLKENWKEEMVVARVYRALAQQEADERRRNLLSLMAVSEEEHASLWAERLRELGVAVDPSEANDPFREQKRQIGAVGVGAMIRRIEREERGHVAEYQAQIRALNDPACTAILEQVIPDERAHAERLHAMVREATGTVARPGLRQGLLALRHLPHDAQVALLSGLALAVGSLARGSLVAEILFSASMAVAAVPALREAATALRAGKLDVEILMLAAALGAAMIGRPAEGALLLFLFALSGALEGFAMAKTRDAIRRLVGMRPLQARREDETLVPVEAIKPGERILVHPGEAIPLDGKVRDGRSSVDQSAMTGEAEPVSRAPGDRVVGGTLNLDGVLLVEATATAADSALERVIRLVEEAHSEKSLASSERLAERVGRYYAPAVLLGCAGWFLYLWQGAQMSLDDASYRALALLIGASPCALVLSSPAAVLSALAGAGRRGLLIRSGAVLEALSRVTVVAFDKTGTLTSGAADLVSVWVSAGDGDELLAAAAAAELASPHPLARALVRAARRRRLPLPPVAFHQSVPGQGVEAQVGRERVRVGRPEWIEDPRLIPQVEAARETGLSLMAVAVGTRAGLLTFSDAPRGDAQATLAALQRLRIRRPVLLTGDHRQAAEAVARRLAIDDVRADLRPEQKADVVRALADEGEIVAMVGDGVNDAPALARAAVGITLGGIGSDVALDSADVVIMEDRLSAVPEAIALARRARAVAMQNLVASLSSVALLSVTILWRGLDLPWAVIGHEGTTLLVVLNGLRLLRG
jgi:heavy metal translocating P-type ATPase